MTFYKTLFARMGNIKAGKYTSDDGEDLNDTEKVLKKNGIALRDNTNNFRNFGDVLDEVASKWDNYDNVTQHAIATAFAGTRQQEKFFVLMENYSTALEYEAVAAESAGTANKKYTDAYLDSIEARKNALTAAYQSLSQTILNSDLVKRFYDALTIIVNLIDKLLNTGAGKMVAILGIIKIIAAIATKIPQTFSTIRSAIQNVTSALSAMKTGTDTVTTSTAALSSAWQGVFAIIGLAVAAITALTSQYNQMKQERLQNDAELIERFESSAASAVQINKLYKEYKKLSPESEKFKDVEQQIVNLLGDNARILEDLVPGTKAYGDALEYAVKKGTEFAESDVEIRGNRVRAEEALAESKYDVIQGSKLGDSLSRDILEGRGFTGTDFMRISTLANPSTAAEHLQHYARLRLMFEALDDEYNRLRTSGNMEKADTLLNDPLYLTLANFAEGNSSAVDYEQIKTVLKATTRQFVKQFKDEIESAADDQALRDVLFNKIIPGVSDEYGVQSGAFGYEIQKAFEDIIGKTLSIVEDLPSAEKYIESFFDTISGSAAASDLKGTTETIDKLAKAIEEMDGAGQISLETAQQLAELDAKYVDFLDIENGQLVLNTDALRKNAVEKLEAAKATAIANQADERTIKLYDKLIENAKRLGNSNTLERYLNLLDYENTIFGFSYTTDAATPGRTYKEYQEDNYKRARRAILEEIDDYRGRGYSTASPEIMELYKKYIDYSEKQIALRKDMLSDSEEKVKGGIEKENDALEKQKDLLNDIVEARKKALENLKNEKKYQDELADKQKTVSDLETRLATARLDTSASGRANARKIEDELQKARKDLDDFNFDHAVDVVSEKLDAEKDENERLYEQQKADNDARLDRLIESNKNDLENYEEKIKGEVDLVKDALNNLNPYKEGENSVYSRIVEIEGVLQTIEGKIGNENVFTPGGTDKGTYFAGKAARLIAEREAQEADDYRGTIMYKLAAAMADTNASAFGWSDDERNADYRKHLQMFIDDPSKIDTWLKYYPQVKQYHMGGIVGGLSLGENEVFAKLMKGEFVSTPSQMSNFLNKTLPSMTSGNEFNAPLITLQVGSVTEESLPRLEAIVKQAADRVKSELMEGFSKTGFRSSNKRTLSYKVPAT